MPKHRLKINKNGYIVLCDKEGNVIPRQTSLEIKQSVEQPLEVTITCYVEPREIDPEVLKERTYSIVEDIVDDI